MSHARLLCVALVGVALARLAACNSASSRSSKEVATPSSAAASDASSPAPRPANDAHEESEAGMADVAQAEAGDPAQMRCSNASFSLTMSLAEASGATVLEDGTLLVVGDSGRFGAYQQLDPETGKLLSEGKLPLDEGASDDLEGLARRNGRLYGITSSGWMREWVQNGGAWQLARKSYPLAKRGSKLLCRSAHDSNCAENYEGLCLLPDDRFVSDPAGCVGFAAAKASGRLLCLRESKKGLAIDASHSFSVSKPDSLSGCHFDSRGRLWFGNNFFSVNKVGLIEAWQSTKTAKVHSIGPLGLGFSEAIAVAGDDTVYRFSDTAKSPSLLSKHICR